MTKNELQVMINEMVLDSVINEYSNILEQSLLEEQELIEEIKMMKGKTAKSMQLTPFIYSKKYGLEDLDDFEDFFDDIEDLSTSESKNKFASAICNDLDSNSSSTETREKVLDKMLEKIRYKKYFKKDKNKIVTILKDNPKAVKIAALLTAIAVSITAIVMIRKETKRRKRVIKY